MAGDFEAPGSMGSCERRCLQLLGCIIGAVGFGTSISTENVAFASTPTVLQAGVVNSSRAADVVHPPINRPYSRYGYRGCRGSYRYSLALRSDRLRKGAWRQMEIRRPGQQRPASIGTRPQTDCLVNDAGSDGRRNTCLQFTRWSLKT